jgi:hypothetical protein
LSGVYGFAPAGGIGVELMVAPPMLPPEPLVQNALENTSGPLVVRTTNETEFPAGTHSTPKSITTVFVTVGGLEGTLGVGQPGANTEPGATKTLPPEPVNVTCRSAALDPVVFSTVTKRASAANAADPAARQQTKTKN